MLKSDLVETPCTGRIGGTNNRVQNPEKNHPGGAFCGVSQLLETYLSNFHIKYISVPDQFVWSGMGRHRRRRKFLLQLLD
jgi:hypothetical protein